MNDFLLFSGTSNVPLAQSVAQALGTKLGNIEIFRFIDSECHVRVKDDVEGKTIFVLQSLSQIADQNLVEMCLIAQALQQLKATKIVAVIPWMGYSKQDKEFRTGEAVSAQLIAKFIEAAGFSEVITIELHSENLVPFFEIPLQELSTEHMLAAAITQKIDMNHVTVVAPDKGSTSRSELFAREIHVPIVYLQKRRNLVSGAVTVEGISGDVNGQHVILYDDIINTGATAIETSKFLLLSGAKKIFYVATHAILASDAAAKLEQSSIEQILVTDTVSIPDNKKFTRLSVLSVAPLLADAISLKMK